MEAPEEITLFLADDHKVVRDGLLVLFERQGGIRVVGEAGDGRMLVEEAARLKPAVVVTDINMPGLNGVDAVFQLRAAGYAGVIVVLSMRDERHIVSQSFAAGANAYVHKDHAFQQVLTAIAAARRGEKWISPQLASLVHDGTVELLTDLLTAREREVLQLIAEGSSAKEVADRLKVSPKTIETHRANLYAKLGVSNAVELTRIAVKEGIAQV